MTEDLTVIPMDADDREHLLVFLRDPAAGDITWLRTLLARYDIARAFRDALVERPERIEHLCDADWEYAGSFRCNPDESGGVETLR